VSPQDPNPTTRRRRTSSSIASFLLGLSTEHLGKSYHLLFLDYYTLEGILRIPLNGYRRVGGEERKGEHTYPSQCTTKISFRFQCSLLNLSIEAEQTYIYQEKKRKDPLEVLLSPHPVPTALTPFLHTVTSTCPLFKPEKRIKSFLQTHQYKN